MPTQDQVVTYLRQLSDQELAELFYEAIRNRDTSDLPFEQAHFVLAEAHRPDPDHEEWAVDLIACHDSSRYPEGWVSDAPICQSGKCPQCGSRLRSWAKRMICPVCGAQAYGT